MNHRMLWYFASMFLIPKPSNVRYFSALNFLKKWKWCPHRFCQYKIFKTMLWQVKLKNYILRVSNSISYSIYRFFQYFSLSLTVSSKNYRTLRIFWKPSNVLYFNRDVCLYLSCLDSFIKSFVFIIYFGYI